MTIVIVVTVVFFLLTLAGTILSRRSAYKWADAEHVPRATNTPGAMHPVNPQVRPGGHAVPVRPTPRPPQTVITDFDTPRQG